MVKRTTAWLALLLMASLIVSCGDRGCSCNRGDVTLRNADPERLPQPPAETPIRVAAAQILVSYKGALGAPENIKRTKEEARELAAELCGQARQTGADFQALAREHSDGPSASRGGILGALERGELARELEEAAYSMGLGQISDVVETACGFHVITRLEFEEIAVSHILVTFQGAVRARTDRDQQAARTLAEELLARCRETDTDFASVAAEHSDCPSALYGGSLGFISRGQLDSTFEAAAFELQPGGVSEVIETAFGYHIIKRDR